MNTMQSTKADTFTPRKPPLPRHPRIYKRLRFWVEITHEIEAGEEFYNVGIQAEGLDLAGSFNIEFVRWPQRGWLDMHLDTGVQAWADEYWTDIQAAIDRKALEKRQEREFWATRGAHGQQVPRTEA